jgi:hypothetical protein
LGTVENPTATTPGKVNFDNSRRSLFIACEPFEPRAFVGWTLITGVLLLSACASAPPQHEVISASPKTNRGEMAPIPNPKPQATARSRLSQPAPRTGPASKPAAPPATPQAAPAFPDPARLKANALRAQGLDKLNQGELEPAVALLRQASQLDPQNPLIARDLARALRIRRAVLSKS